MWSAFRSDYGAMPYVTPVMLIIAGAVAGVKVNGKKES
jgi:hypothetical protein